MSEGGRRIVVSKLHKVKYIRKVNILNEQRIRIVGINWVPFSIVFRQVPKPVFSVTRITIYTFIVLQPSATQCKRNVKKSLPLSLYCTLFTL